MKRSTLKWLQVLALATVAGLCILTYRSTGRLFPIQVPISNPAKLAQSILENKAKIPGSILDVDVLRQLIPQGDTEEESPDWRGPIYGVTDRMCQGRLNPKRTYVDIGRIEDWAQFRDWRGISRSDVPEKWYCESGSDTIVYVAEDQKTLLTINLKNGNVKRHPYPNSKP